MARLIGPDDGSRLAYGMDVNNRLTSAAGLPAVVYSDEAGTLLADILTYPGGIAVPDSELTVAATSLLPLFQFPDGADVVYVSVNGGPVTAVYARSFSAGGGILYGDLELAAGQMLTILSSFDGGEDEGQPGQFDSTGRLNLESYQRADFHSYGEVLRIYSRRADSKQMIAWYGPDDFDDITREPIGNDRPWFWMGAHYEANDHGSIHGHWSCEVPDTTGALQTRLELPIWNPVTGQYGMDKGVIKTNAADLNVRCSNGQELRLSAPSGNTKPITFSNDSDGRDDYRRWQIRATNEAESTGNAGTNFGIARYGDDGVLIDSPIVISRSTGNITFGPGFIARRSSSTVSTLSLNTTSLGGGQGVIAIGNAGTVPSTTPSAGGVLYAEGGELKWRSSTPVITQLTSGAWVAAGATPATDITLAAAWSADVSGTYFDFGFRAAPNGKLEGSGRLNTTTDYTANATIFTLPTALRPTKNVVIPVRVGGSGAAAGFMTITSGGVGSFSASFTAGAGSFLQVDCVDVRRT